MAWLVGLASAALVLLAYAAGWLDWIELKTLDWRFQYCNALQADARVVCIDIDDGSLELVGRWPWSRIAQSSLLRIPAECGARALLVDLTYVEGEPIALDAPPDADLLLDPLDDPEGALQAVAPDLELRRAIADAGNVHLAFHHVARDPFVSETFEKLVDALQSDDAAARAPLLPAFAATRSGQLAPLDLARLVAELERAPAQAPETLAQTLKLPLAPVEMAFQASRFLALRRTVTRHWRSGAPVSADLGEIRKLYERLHDSPFENDSGFKRALLAAWRYALGEAAALRHALPATADAARVAERVDTIVPVYFLHAQAARGLGFVTFEPDPDGVVRRMALFVREGSEVYPQLALSVACDVLEIDLHHATLRERRMILKPRDAPPRVLQLDAAGRVLLPWIGPYAGKPAEQPFVHIPAARLIELHDLQRQMAENQRAIRDTIERVRAADFYPDAQQYAQTLLECKQLRAARRAARLRSATPEPDAPDACDAQLERLEAEGFAVLRAELQRLSERPAESLSLDEQLRLEVLETLQRALARTAVFEAANARLAQEAAALRAWLQARLSDRVCLLGYTATSLADMTPIPTSPRAPGVLAHAALLNGMLTNRLMTWATPLSNLALAGLCCALAATVSVSARPRTALAAIAALLLVVSALAAWLFVHAQYWLALTPSVLGVVAVFAAVSAYRFIFVDRERRQLATALGQYTSKAMARQLAENAELCRRAEMREVTAIFTDLRGFTTISERIGAERTQKVLNLCLGRFTDVMLRHDAMVNKFIGDGVFAFWNPVILPQPDHAARACETALDLLTGLRELAVEQRARSGDEVFGELVVRVGVATGNAVVGPCGSEQKYDYTCIGDSVNVAARLESANKFYGTQILVSAETRAQAGERFAYRGLGGVQVKGKRKGVQIYELLGRNGALPQPLRDYAADFEAAVALFGSRKFREALEAFGALARRRPDDRAADEYLAASANLLASPPPDNWNGAIALTEK